MNFYSSVQNLPKEEVGGKAYNLFKLKAMGMQVPDWITIPQSELQKVIRNHTLNDHETIKKSILDYSIPNDSINEIVSKLGPDEATYAVRSSAIGEDGKNYSFAGQFETYLYVKKENLAKNIKKVWLSAFSERVTAYRKIHGLSVHFGIAVIIQKMVDAEVAGVGFSANPINGNSKEKLISAVYGSGEGLVSGELNADTYIIKNNNIESKLVEKSHAFVFSENGGTKKISLKNGMKYQPCLSDKNLKKIDKTLEQLQLEIGSPQDIEFAFSNDQFYLLQTRPITNFQATADKEGEHIIWDNSNIVESYPGVTTPLTFSFISKIYEAVYRQLSGIMGVSKEVIEANANTFANTLGLIDGRVYYNLLSWYKMLAMFPAYSLNAEFMETMMGVKEKFKLKTKNTTSKTKAYLRVISVIFSMLKNLITLPRQRKKFVRQTNEVIKNYKAMDFSKRRADELMYLYMDFEKVLLKKWKAPLINDFFAMIYFGVLQKMILGYQISENPNLHNDLLCGSKDIISTEPIKHSLHIADLVSKNEKAKTYFLENDARTIWQSLSEGAHPEIKSAIDLYIDQFGERCVGELKLETVSYTQDPSLFVRIIKSYISQSNLHPLEGSETKNILRTKAEKTIRQYLKFKPFKRLLFNYVLRNTRSLVSNRENLRFERTKAFGIVRSIFTALGKKFFQKGIIEKEKDIFYLQKEEIFAFIQGTSATTDLKKLIQLRKEEFEGFKQKNKPAERIHTYDIVNHGNDFYTETKKELTNGSLKGIGCCPGRVKAKVQIVNDPHEVESLNGDILVTSNTDPGWVVLFPTTSAIIVERGSLLSHSAIVSREMNIPCIVSVDGLLDTLKSGDVVEMDGSTGIIKIIDQNEKETT